MSTTTPPNEHHRSFRLTTPTRQNAFGGLIGIAGFVAIRAIVLHLWGVLAGAIVAGLILVFLLKRVQRPSPPSDLSRRRWFRLFQVIYWVPGVVILVIVVAMMFWGVNSEVSENTRWLTILIALAVVFGLYYLIRALIGYIARGR